MLANATYLIVHRRARSSNTVGQSKTNLKNKWDLELTLIQFTEVLQLVHDSVENLQRLPCILESMAGNEFVERTSLMDEACTLLTMCVHAQRKIVVCFLITPREF